MFELIRVVTNREKKEFLNFPKELYIEDLKQDYKVEKQLLNNNHVLSKYFDLFPFVLKDNGKVIARCAITIYKEKIKEAYIGFYECIENFQASNFMLRSIESFVKEKGISKLIGPVDASFWLKYRFKTNGFGNVSYSSEPYNKEYYPNYFKKSGYNVKAHYFSNIFPKVSIEMNNEKFKKRLKLMRERGYIIKNASFFKFNKQIKEIYKILIELYSSFPLFMNISEKEFCILFKKLKYFLNYRMVKLGYRNNKLVGFFICVPNYGCTKKISEILKIRKHPNEYILLYLGADKTARGMGAALSESIWNELMLQEATSIGALIIDNKVSGKYYKEIVTGVYEYELLEKEI